jgi:hypothetical protein
MLSIWRAKRLRIGLRAAFALALPEAIALPVHFQDVAGQLFLEAQQAFLIPRFQQLVDQAGSGSEAYAMTR